MAKGAATEAALGGIHMKLTNIYMKILQRYSDKLDALAEINTDDVADEMLEILLGDDALPSPAMLSAVSKFLKDNEVTMDTEQLDELSAMEERLKNKSRDRPNLQQISNLKLVDNG